MAGIIEPVFNTHPQRYRFEEKSSVSEAIVRLDGAMNAAGVAGTNSDDQ